MKPESAWPKRVFRWSSARWDGEHELIYVCLTPWQGPVLRVLVLHADAPSTRKYGYRYFEPGDVIELCPSDEKWVGAVRVA